MNRPEHKTDEEYMRLALAEAEKAAACGETPVGAVLVIGGEVIARAHNMRETWQDPTAHAEAIVLREASTRLGRWRLEDATLYVTLEPCLMCAGALVLARVNRLVYGCRDSRPEHSGPCMMWCETAGLIMSTESRRECSRLNAGACSRGFLNNDAGRSDESDELSVW
jgi:tRNA(Arg) A34 adenosine deaminase TadA